MFLILISSSFLGGVAALFAPCCVTVLLPLYIGSIFKRTTKVLAMTGVFSLGLALVLVPITLGAGLLAEIFHIYHQQLYIFGGVMIMLAGLAVLFGIKMPMPRLKTPRMDEGLGWGGALTLGIFSGIASACCAPVLAGSVTLAVLSGSFARATVVSLFYVLGMAMPLLLIAVLWDKMAVSRMQVVRRYGAAFKYVAGAVFIAVGIMLFYLGATGNEWWAPVWQQNFSEWLKEISFQIIEWIRTAL